jgi:phosphatidylethanolamine/phosphatidyl-N-methylethanolamine N-methyltransferase
VKLLKEFIADPEMVGAIAESSSYLARMLVEGLDLQNASAVLEYGPGTGVVTDYILRELNPRAKFAAIEVNAEFAAHFRARHPSVALYEDSVANARAICDQAGIEAADCIVSGLPWGGFPDSLQIKLMDEMMSVLKPGGRFVTFAYVHAAGLQPRARRFPMRLRQYFTSVSKSPIVWLNVPPAFVYRCRR